MIRQAVLTPDGDLAGCTASEEWPCRCLPKCVP
jgi:hypothetical protein